MDPDGVNGPGRTGKLDFKITGSQHELYQLAHADGEIDLHVIRKRLRHEKYPIAVYPKNCYQKTVRKATGRSLDAKAPERIP
jgi:hypothetical protein